MENITLEKIIKFDSTIVSLEDLHIDNNLKYLHMLYFLCVRESCFNFFFFLRRPLPSPCFNFYLFGKLSFNNIKEEE